MGLTRFKGPVYGSKSLLWAYGPVACDTPSTAANTTGLYKQGASRTLSPYEDWFVTEFYVNYSTCSSQGAHSLLLKSEGGSTTILPNLEAPGNGSTRAQTIATATLASPSTTGDALAVATADAAEYEGTWVPAGSTLRVVYSHVGSTTAEVLTASWSVMGYLRHRASTRGEGG